MKENSEVDLFRIAIGLVFGVYYAAHFAELNFLFGPNQMIDAALLEHFAPSILLALPTYFVVYVLYACLLSLIAAFTFGKLGRIGVFALFVCHLSFENANPLIIHEPQQLMTVALILFLAFLDPRGHAKQDAALVKITLGALGAYYLAVGIGKLPDPAWRDGSAVGSLAKWNGIAFQNSLTTAVATHGFISRLCTWFSLVLELSYLPLIFTRFRPALIILVLFFHLCIATCFDLGNISLAMIALNFIALDAKTRAVYRFWFIRLRNSGASRRRQIYPSMK